MPVQRDRPYAGMNFHVDLGLGDGPDAGVSEVVFPEARLQVNEYRNGNDRVLEATKLPTLTRYDNLLLRRGVTGSLAWYQWWDEARNGGDAQRTVAITLLDEQGNPVEFDAEDRFARILQHEVDHLHGTLFIDHLSSLKRALYKKKLKKILREEA